MGKQKQKTLQIVFSELANLDTNSTLGSALSLWPDSATCPTVTQPKLPRRGPESWYQPHLVGLNEI